MQKLLAKSLSLFASIANITPGPSIFSVNATETLRQQCATLRPGWWTCLLSRAAWIVEYRWWAVKFNWFHSKILHLSS